MANIIAITNQKGGVGKTTTAVNLAASMAAGERKTLLIDLDPQSNSTSGLGIQNPQNTIYQVLSSHKSVPEATHPTSLDFLKIVPASRDLAGAEIELVGVIGRENILKEALLEVDNLYDFILIDCPPSLGLLTINALTAAHSYLIPLQCEYYAMEGLSKLIHTVKLIRQRLNPNLKQEGILLTMFDKRNNLCHQVAHEVRSHFKKDVFESVIPRNVRLSECPSHGKPIILYDIGSAGAESYLQLAQEIIGRY